ncbi:tetratricopeptide repeat protein [uncultured Deinococcus sp.]|uniref:tetratricopeptide repeat protein n=1 Tax=uncultured Deinococcus sp. TaxID=158789 RepID=UPI0025E829EE|nr:tetratricopeptide repeat protein [uncultured Deinococcus sp.]
MTDPAGVTRQDAPDLALPDLGDLIRAGEWRRALATARVGRADAELEDALSAVVGILEAVRARRAPAARRALRDLREALAGGTAPEFTVLRRHLDLDAIEAALTAVSTRAADLPEQADLEASLAPALAVALTRAEALNTLGVRAAALGDTDRARDLFEEALASDPGHYRAMTNLGNLSLEAGDAVAAEARYREAIRLNAEFDGAHHNLGVALRRQGRVGEAVGAIRRGQRLGMRRSKDDTEAEMKEQFAATPVLRWGRMALLVAIVVLVVLALRSAVG